MTRGREHDLSLPAAAFALIDQAALDFENAWRESHRPQIASFLVGFEGEERTELLRELLLIDLEYRRAAGDDPEAAAYEAEFPHDVAVVQSAFERERRRKQAAAEHSRAAIRQALFSTPHTIAAGDTSAGLDRDFDGDEVDSRGMPRQVGDYEILEPLGRGGMGVVFKARQASLNRIVALKMILSGRHASQQEIQRFRAEAESAAKLQHRNIVPIYEIGEHQGRHFFSMGYVEGRSLDQFIEDNPLSSRDAARYVQQIAAAVHYAHEQGVLHRDLKPSNVLIDHDDEPHIADFGLAKLTTSDAGLTMTGQVLGTPNYIAPEQALGQSKDVKATSDVYSLGAMLYALVTGRPPFNAETTAATIMQLIETEPVPPALVNPNVDQDLETITLKCLEKSPHKRYATAEELSVELGRYLRGEPIHARRISVAGRLRRWCSRNRAVAALLVVIMLALASGTGVSTYFALQARSQARVAELQAIEATAARRLADEKAADAERNAEKERQANYIQSVALAQRELSAMHGVRADELLESCPPHLRAWEWYYLKRRRRGKPLVLPGRMGGTWKGVTFSPDGRYIAASGYEKRQGRLRIWDVRAPYDYRDMEPAGDELTECAFSVDGKRLIGACIDDAVRVWDVGSGKIVEEIRHEVISWPMGVAVSPDGTYIAIAGGMSRKCLTIDAQTYEPLHIFPGHYHQAHHVAISSDSRLLSTASIWNSTVRLWDAKTGQHLRDLKSDCTMMLRSAISPQRNLVATTGRKNIDGDEGELKVWDSETGALIHSLTGHSGTVESVAFSPDGSRMASVGNDEVVIVWDAETGRDIITLRGHEAPIWDVAFSPDGQRIATGGEDGTVRLWEATPLDESASAELITDYRDHEGRVTSVAFSPDGKLVATGGQRGSVRVWDPATGETLHRLQTDTRWLNEKTGTFQTEAGEVIDTTNRSDTQIGSVFFDTTGKWIIGHDLKQMLYWNLATGANQRTRGKTGGGMFFSLARSDDGRQMVSGHWNSKMTAWSLAADEEGIAIEEAYVIPRARTSHSLFAVVISPDNKMCAVGGGKGAIDVRYLETGGEHLRIEGHEGSVRALDFHRNNQRLVSGGEDGIIRVWDINSGEELLALDDHTDVVRDIEFSADGRWLASASKDRTIKIWRADTGQVVRTLVGHTEAVFDIAFDPQGKRLVSSAGDGSVKVWDVSQICTPAEAGE